MYKHVNYFEKYDRIMQFNKNKSVPIHRWYPFVEGYSREFIESILKEVNSNNIVCLEPFSGSGTTALELQNHGIKCVSFEVNPFMYLLAKVKLENSYDIDRLDYWYNYICNNRNDALCELKTNFSTLYEDENKTKWNYDKIVGFAVEKLRITIESISEEIYHDIFIVALASILLDVSNLYRNGKCLSYKKNWKNTTLSEKDVFAKFDSKFSNEIRPDIYNNSNNKSKFCNKMYLYNMDSRLGISEMVDDNSIDLVITSPPYLNSRDYTDTYMLELKTLGFTKTTNDIKLLREKTLRSHVQLNWDDETKIENKLLDSTMKRIECKINNDNLWNNSILDMIRLYFVDMKKIFRVLYKKMKSNGKIYFNVSNSAYFSELVDTLEICASIAEDEGFNIIEIRDARNLKSSPQQKKDIGYLLEGIIVMER